VKNKTKGRDVVEYKVWAHVEQIVNDEPSCETELPTELGCFSSMEDATAFIETLENVTEAGEGEERKYTVLLLRPDYQADQSGDSILMHVKGRTVEEAQDKARTDAAATDEVAPSDYVVLCVFEGVLQDVKED
jgi:hypothetical protein